MTMQYGEMPFGRMSVSGGQTLDVGVPEIQVTQAYGTYSAGEAAVASRKHGGHCENNRFGCR